MGLSSHTSDLFGLVTSNRISIHVQIIYVFLSLSINLLILLSLCTSLSLLWCWPRSRVIWPHSLFLIRIICKSSLPCGSRLRLCRLLWLRYICNFKLLFSDLINCFCKCSLSQSVFIHILWIILLNFIFNVFQSFNSANIWLYSIVFLLL